MKKKIIYITEEIADKLYQYNIPPLKQIPSDIKNALRNHKTSLGVHPSYPPEEELSFDRIITEKRFEEVYQKVLDLNLEDYSTKIIQKKSPPFSGGGISIFRILCFIGYRLGIRHPIRQLLDCQWCILYLQSLLQLAFS
jgi:hypothetical protein